MIPYKNRYLCDVCGKYHKNAQLKCEKMKKEKNKEQENECTCSTMQICNDLRTCPYCLSKNETKK